MPPELRATPRAADQQTPTTDLYRHQQSRGCGNPILTVKAITVVPDTARTPRDAPIRRELSLAPFHQPKDQDFTRQRLARQTVGTPALLSWPARGRPPSQ